MMTLRTQVTLRSALLRRLLCVASAAALCAAHASADAATKHPATHAVAAKPHAFPVKAKAEPVAHNTSAQPGGRFRSASSAKPVATRAAAQTATHGKSHRLDVDDEPTGKAHAKSQTKTRGKAARAANDDEPATTAKGKKLKGRATAAPERPAAKSTGKGKRRQQQPADDSDYDPPVLYRAGTKRRVISPPASTPHVASAREPRPMPAPEPQPQEAAGAPEPTGSAFPDGQVTGHHERRPGPAAAAAKHGGTAPAASPSASTTQNTTPEPARTQATNQDFLRAAGIARVDAPARPQPATADRGETGESHPDDDVRVDMRVPPGTHTVTYRPATLPRVLPAPSTAPVVTANGPLPAPAAPATLPEKLRSAAAKAETAAKSDVASLKPAVKSRSAKVSILPDDLAGKDAVIEDAMTPMLLPDLYTTGGRLIVPPPMKGSHDILVHQNTMADADGLDRIQDDDDLNQMRAAHLLVPIPESAALEVNPDLPYNRRYARPWTERFVQDIAHAYYAHFRQPLRLSSAVRTVAYQLRLQRVNGNAAAVDGDGASPHLTGQAIDFGKHGMSVAEIAWMRAYLGPVMDSGKIDVEEEFQQACFHISVYKSYMPAPAKKPRVLQVAEVHAAPIVRRAPRPERASAEAPDDDAQQ